MGAQFNLRLKTMTRKQRVSRRSGSFQNTRLSNLEYLGADMVEAGNEFGPGTPYGSSLIRVGQTQQALGETERNFIRKVHCQFLPL